MKELLRVRCKQGKLVIYEDRVSIELKSIFTNTAQTLFLNQITGVQVVTKITSVLGMGGANDVIVYGTGNQKLEASLVGGKDSKQVEQIINQLLAQRQTTTVQSAPTIQSSNLDELKKLSDLQQQGVITSEEFEAKKKQLLGL